MSERPVPAQQLVGSLVTLQIDRPLGSKHPVYGFEYLLNYGYLPGTVSGDGEPVDAYVLGVATAIDSFTGRCIAVVHRLDVNDDKLVVVPDGLEFTDAEIRVATIFQEQFFRSVILRGH